ncbi:MAG: hypothetical protein R2705_08120 [Ilumatobacteraceae bacterium]
MSLPTPAAASPWPAPDPAKVATNPAFVDDATVVADNVSVWFGAKVAPAT